MKVALIFPPGWTLATGSPHLALALLKAYLEAHGVETSTRDLNYDAIPRHIHVSAAAAEQACRDATLDSMNEPYFSAEDHLMAIALRFGARWNAQLGFEYEDSPQRSSHMALAAVSRSSPFDSLYSESVVPQLLREDAAIVGICLASVYQIVPTLQLCKRLRESGFSGFVVLGGNTVSRLSRELSIPAVFRLVDGLITFQGEIPLLQLCRTLERGGSLTAVPQLVWRDGDDIRTNPAAIPVQPDTVPVPDYQDLPVGKYWGENYLNLVAARGCYYGKCDFCAIPYGWGSNGYSGMRSPEHVFNDMVALLSRHGINRFKFVDEALSPAFMRALAERILADGVRVEWEGYTRLEAAWYDQAFVELVARAGFRKGYFGLELVPSEQRSLLNKKDRPYPDRLLGTCHPNGVKVHFFCMFGFPGTGEPEARSTVDFLLRNKDAIDTADIFPWMYAKHTRVSGAEPIYEPREDWVLEYQHRGMAPHVLPSEAVAELASECEEILWCEVPRFLHPTYRLVSPWTTTARERLFSAATRTSREMIGS